MVIWSEFRMGQYRDDDHREDAPHFRSRVKDRDQSISENTKATQKE